MPQDFSRAILNLMNNACYAVFSKSKEIADATYQPTIRICLKKEGDCVGFDHRIVRRDGEIRWVTGA